MRVTPNFSTQLNQIQHFLTHNGISLRYEKGRFKNGGCIINSKQQIVLNKFYPDELKVGFLIEFLSQHVSNDTSDFHLNRDDLQQFLQHFYTKYQPARYKTQLI